MPFEDSTMKIIYTEALRQSADLFVLAQQATRVLEDVVGQSFLPVVAKWDRDRDEQGQFVAVLHLSEETEAATVRFTPAELADMTNLDIRLSRLWGDLLESISHKQIAELFKSIGNAGSFENARQD